MRWQDLESDAEPGSWKGLELRVEARSTRTRPAASQLPSFQLCSLFLVGGRQRGSAT
jgi:hypothetical protein